MAPTSSTRRDLHGPLGVGSALCWTHWSGSSAWRASTKFGVSIGWLGAWRPNLGNLRRNDSDVLGDHGRTRATERAKLFSVSDARTVRRPYVGLLLSNSPLRFTPTPARIPS